MAEELSSKLGLISLPVELLLRIYELLPSFIDALAFRATCQILHNVWVANHTAIRNALVLDRLECYPHARKLLEDQRKGQKLEENPSDQDLCSLVKNAQYIEEAIIVKMEDKLIPMLGFENLPEGERRTIYDYGGNGAHPPKLTPTERLRVIRACYQIWSLSFDSENGARAKCLVLQPRQLYYLAQMADICRAMKFPTEEAWQTLFIIRDVRDTLTIIYHLKYTRSSSMRECSIWDYRQETLKNSICTIGREQFAIERLRAHGRTLTHLWEYEPGDELFITS